MFKPVGHKVSQHVFKFLDTDLIQASVSKFDQALKFMPLNRNCTLVLSTCDLETILPAVSSLIVFDGPLICVLLCWFWRIPHAY